MPSGILETLASKITLLILRAALDLELEIKGHRQLA